MVRYLARNAGDLELICEGDMLGLSETNTELLPSLFGTTIPVDTGTVVELTSVTQACSETLDDAEPDTATIDCECLLDGDFLASASDE
ncbi:MAG: hypothetical protein GWN84_05350, partial [Gammaproteobacteria bacterium]|nr:hypothetical protein [Gammaproteobacteria bacterium]NIR82388.1 hypothetical protein [Gammaproteobacteria bacterium]NIV76994.1 hypothetical protein [Gammaproteobacteria bacterium]